VEWELSHHDDCGCDPCYGCHSGKRPGKRGKRVVGCDESGSAGVGRIDSDHQLEKGPGSRGRLSVKTVSRWPFCCAASLISLGLYRDESGVHCLRPFVQQMQLLASNFFHRRNLPAVPFEFWSPNRKQPVLWLIPNGWTERSRRRRVRCCMGL